MARPAAPPVVVLVALVVVSASAGAVSGGRDTGAAGAPDTLSECTDITESGVYELEGDFGHTGSQISTSCLFVNASDVVIEGNGRTLGGRGVSNTVAIHAVDAANVTVRNVTVANWQRGIYYENVSGGSVENVSAESNVYAVALTDTSGVTVSDSTVTGNFVGVRIEGTTDNAFANATVRANRVGRVLEDIEIDAPLVHTTVGPPTDHDGDGLYEDVTGDGERTLRDELVLAAVVTADVVGWADPSADQVRALDFDGNGRLGYGDALAL